MVKINTNERLSSKEAAAYLGISTKTLLKYVRGGLRRQHIGPKLVHYRKADLDEWITASRAKFIDAEPVPEWVSKLPDQASEDWVQRRRETYINR